MGLLSAVFDRLTALTESVAETAARRAAPRIEEALKTAATTRRGNIPQFGPGAHGHPGGWVPISATADGAVVNVRGPEWVMQKAAEKGQPAEWAEIVREEARRAAR